MNYDDYKIEDFLSDPEFKNWVLHPTDSSQLFWKNWMESHSNQKRAIQSAREIILSLKYQSAEKISIEEREGALKKVLNKQKTNLEYNNILRIPKIYYRVAAAILFLTSVSFYVIDQNIKGSENVQQPIAQIVKENPKGQKTKIILPDGSKVWLNSESRLEYPSVFTGKRQVSLRGEAFFEVTENPNKPFEVFSNGVLTTALGTSFNINAFEENSVVVGLVTGKISVETNNTLKEDRVFANPGEMVVYNANSRFLNVQHYANLDFMQWTNRIIVFKRANYQQIKKKLERWYDVTINVKNADKKMTFTGEFENESLELILERMAFVEKFDFEIKGKQVDIIF
jgi:transmembrane sensor